MRNIGMWIFFGFLPIIGVILLNFLRRERTVSIDEEEDEDVDDIDQAGVPEEIGIVDYETRAISQGRIRQILAAFSTWLAALIREGRDEEGRETVRGGSLNSDQNVGGSVAGTPATQAAPSPASPSAPAVGGTQTLTRTPAAAAGGAVTTVPGVNGAAGKAAATVLGRSGAGVVLNIEDKGKADQAAGEKKLVIVGGSQGIVDKSDENVNKGAAAPSPSSNSRGVAPAVSVTESLNNLYGFSQAT